MNHFTPVSAAIGGVLIGLAASMLLYFNGRIAGISGIVGHMLNRKGDMPWRLAFLAGFIATAGVFFVARPASFGVPTGVSLPFIAFAGLLVGFGTRLANGCTSGHGVCGIGRFSKRSVTATLTFMATAAAVVLVLRHVASVGAP